MSLIVLIGVGSQPTFATTRTHWFTSIDDNGKGAQIGLVEGDEAQEYGSIFYGRCRPPAFSVQFDDETNAKITGPDVYPIIHFIAGKKILEPQFDTLKFSDAPGGWQAQVEITKADLETMSMAPSLAVEVVDNSNDQKVIQRIDYPITDMRKSFAEFIKACF